MNSSSRSIHIRWVFPSVLIVALFLALAENRAGAQAKTTPGADVFPELPYGVSRAESRPSSTPPPPEPFGVTVAPAAPAEPRRAPLPRRKPPVKVFPETGLTGVPVPALVPSSGSVPAPAPAPPNPLWDAPDAGSIGVESGEALGRKLHLPANSHGLGPISPLGLSALLGLLALAAVAMVLGQRSGRTEERKSRRQSRRKPA
jgi:hypothetical protein